MEPLALRCIVKAVTGYDCPFCGFQRSMYALFQGEFKEAFLYNPYIYILSPYIVLLLLCAIGIIPQDSKLCRALYSRTSIIIAAVLTVSWWIIRNVI